LLKNFNSIKYKFKIVQVCRIVGSGWTVVASEPRRGRGTDFLVVFQKPSAV
jgi:hypothetical protein